MNKDDNGSKEIIVYQYSFKLSNGEEKQFDIHLKKKTLDLILQKRDTYPDWTKLEHFKCPICPLKQADNKYCPIAKNLIDIIEFFKTSVSFHEADVLICTEARDYMKHTSLQKGLSSLIGIYMVTSGCPVMDKLRPMVRYHLPFATLEETRYRAISMYLIAQYLLYRRGKQPDWDLKNLVKIYDDVRIINQNFHQRLLSIRVEDASMNALMVLNSFADFVPFTINKSILDELELLFSAYLT